jgi:hypothetical protein
MELKVTLPDDLAEALRELTAKEGLTPEQWVLNALWSRFPLLKAKKRPKRTPEEIRASLDRIASHFGNTGVSLSDEALRRENMYED